MNINEKWLSCKHGVLLALRCEECEREQAGRSKELTLGDIESFLTKHDLQLRVYLERGSDAVKYDGRGEWMASLYAKGMLDLVPSQMQTVVYAASMGAAVEDVIRQWRLSHGGAS